jgi:hypothetical protein
LGPRDGSSGGVVVANDTSGSVGLRRTRDGSSGGVGVADARGICL